MAKRLRKLKNVKQVFIELGGYVEVARLTGRHPTTVHNWRSRNACAASTYKMMMEALARRGATAPGRLWGQRDLAA